MLGKEEVFQIQIGIEFRQETGCKCVGDIVIHMDGVAFRFRFSFRMTIDGNARYLVLMTT